MNIFSFLSYEFIQRAYFAGSFIAAVCGILGIFLVLRKLSLIGDGLSHMSFGAIALGLFFGIYPFSIAIPLVIIGSYFVLKLSERARLYGDAAIGIVSSVGIAIGIILASAAHGFNVDLFAYLFGNILTISALEMWSTIILSIVVLFFVIFFYHDLFSVTFDEQHAKISGIPVTYINTMLTTLTAITVVLAIKVVGIMLVSALLVLPAVTALQLAKGFKIAVIISMITAILSILFGITISFFADLPAGGMIVLINLFFFLFSLFFRKIKIGLK